jgi:hypothetical protein
MNIELTDEQVHKLATAAGYVKAPAPVQTPPQTEAERLVMMSYRLPQELWAGSGWRDRAMIDDRGNVNLFGDGECFTFDCHQFRTILLGVMAAYVGTEPNARVAVGWDGRFYWYSGDDSNDATDLIAAYLDCCLAIHARRARNAK